MNQNHATGFRITSQDVTECDHGVASECNGDQLEVVKALQKNTRTTQELSPRKPVCDELRGELFQDRAFDSLDAPELPGKEEIKLPDTTEFNYSGLGGGDGVRNFEPHSGNSRGMERLSQE